MRPCFFVLPLLGMIVGACSEHHMQRVDANLASEREVDGGEEATDPGDPGAAEGMDGQAGEPEDEEGAGNGDEARPPAAQDAEAAEDAGTDADSCAVQRLVLSERAPDVLIVFDRSGSMSLEQRWEPSKQAIKAVTEEFDSVVAFGLETFPGEGAATDADILSVVLSNGDPRMLCAGNIDIDLPNALGNADGIAAALDAMQTIGFTPTAQALRAAATYLGARSPVSGARRGYVLLVTDGDPMCDLNASLDGAGDTAAREATKAAVSALAQNDVATYVVGYQIDPVHQPFMHELAMLGGTARYRPVEGADQMTAVLREISSDVIDCSFALQAGSVDPAHLQVTLDGIEVPRGAEGWTLAGSKLELGGSACETLRNGARHEIELQCDRARAP